MTAHETRRAALLRARRERPSGRCTAESKDELAPSHRLTPGPRIADEL
jgi:hypothetical protein